MIYVIGMLELDAQRRELSRAPQDPVKMTEKAVDVLLSLLEHQSEWVTRDALMQAVWPDVAVNENSLAQRLREIRECLEQHGVLAPVIEYKRGKGYRFIAPFEVRFLTTTLTPDELQPFVPGPPIMHPFQFFGRKHELAELLTLWHGLPLLNAAIIGPRRRGKTSLLLYLRHLGTVPLSHLRPDQQAHRRQWLPNLSRLRWVFVNFQSPQFSTQAGVLQYLLHGLGLPVPEPCDLDRFYEVVSDGLRAPAVILLDEIGVAMHDYTALGDRFWTSLRALAQQVEGKLGFVFAASDPIVRLARHNCLESPFFNIFGHTVNFGPLAEPEARALIASSPIPFSSDDEEWII